VSSNQVNGILHLLKTQESVNVTLIPLIVGFPNNNKKVYVNYIVWLKDDLKDDHAPMEIVEAQEIVIATDVTVCK
jgi:hypothetical protein